VRKAPFSTVKKRQTCEPDNIERWAVGRRIVPVCSGSFFVALYLQRFQDLSSDVVGHRLTVGTETDLEECKYGYTR